MAQQAMAQKNNPTVPTIGKFSSLLTRKMNENYCINKKLNSRSFRIFGATLLIIESSTPFHLIISWLKMLTLCEKKGGMQGMPESKGSDLVDEEMWVRMNSG